MPLQFSKRLYRANFIAGKTLCVRKIRSGECANLQRGSDRCANYDPAQEFHQAGQSKGKP